MMVVLVEIPASIFSDYAGFWILVLFGVGLAAFDQFRQLVLKILS
jgi:hypothetical protein